MITIMRTTHIGRVDLNLVPPLVALLEEQHVSRAAERVGLSQPAMSRALQRLRRLLDDPLLIRDSTGYRLTARAETLRAQLSSLLPQLETVFAPGRFDPHTSAQPVHVAATDYGVQTFGPAICRELVRQSAAARFASTAGVTTASPNRSGPPASIWACTAATALRTFTPRNS